MAEQKQNPILRFLGNPLVQGMGLATATTGNPLLGLLAAPIIGGARDAMQAGNEEARRRLTERRERIQARDDAVANLPSVLSPGSPLTPAGRQAELLKTATHLNPGSVGTALTEQALPSTRAPTGLLAIAEQIRQENPSLSMSEALTQAAAIQAGSDPNAATETELLNSQAELAAIQLEAAKTERDSRVRSIQGTASSVMDVATSALEHNESLSGSLLASGSLASTLPREMLAAAEIGTQIFAGPEEAKSFRKTIVELDKFKKDLIDLNTQVFSMLENAGVSMSNQLRNQITEGSASVSVDPEANRAIVFRILDRALALAEQQGVDIPEIRETQQKLQAKYSGDPIETYLNTMPGYAEATPQEKAEARRLLQQEMEQK